VFGKRLTTIHTFTILLQELLCDFRIDLLRLALRSRRSAGGLGRGSSGPRRRSTIGLGRGSSGPRRRSTVGLGRGSSGPRRRSRNGTGSSSRHFGSASLNRRCAGFGTRNRVFMILHAFPRFAKAQFGAAIFGHFFLEKSDSFSAPTLLIVFHFHWATVR